MKSTKEIGEKIVEKLVALESAEDVKLFREVKRYSFARLSPETFPNDLLKLKMPTCLVVMAADTNDGKPTKREINWILVLAFKGTEEAAGDACTNAIDMIRAQVLGQALFDKVNLRPTSKLSMQESTAAYTGAALTCVTVEHA